MRQHDYLLIKGKQRLYHSLWGLSLCQDRTVAFRMGQRGEGRDPDRKKENMLQAMKCKVVRTENAQIDWCV